MFCSLRSFLGLLTVALCAGWPARAALATTFEDNMAQRTLACVACHGEQGRAGPDGYYPRLAGKPAGYLYNQLLNLRDGRRHYGLMTRLVEPLSDAYLMEIAQYFSALDAPYPPPAASTAAPAVLALGRQLVTQGDASRQLPACVSCHGQALTGAAPHIPGLLGLPRDYLNAQLGGWQTGQRRAHAPDCMATIARQLSGPEVSAIAHWLAAQPLPAHPQALTALPPAAPDSPRARCGSAPAPQPASAEGLPTPPPQTASAVAQGEYLARAGNCMHCHTVQGGTPFAGGRGIATPFGTVFSSNLTPDPVQGLGAWSAEDFWQAMHHGRSKGGRLLNPAFPYTSFTHVSRADSDALFAYLQTRPASAQPNRAHTLRWPFGTQAALIAWRTLYFTPAAYQADTTQTAQWNRGAYLVRGLGHCSACHTPRNALGALKTTLDLSGSMIPMQNWYAPSLRTVQEAGTSPEQLQHSIDLLQTGTSPSGVATGPMADVVRHSTQYLSAGDLRAMAVFLSTLPLNPVPAPSVKTTTAASPLLIQGSKIYDAQCAQCHGKQGEGVKGAYPALAGNRAVTLPHTVNLVQMVLYGGYAPATAGHPRPFGMPPFVLQLNDASTAAVLTYIRNSWGNQAPALSELDINRARDARMR